MVDAKPYLTSSLSIYCYANLHELLIKSILSYLIISCGIQIFFVSITVVDLYVPESSISSPWPPTHVVFFSAYLKKTQRYLEHVWYNCCRLYALSDCLALLGKSR
jgi:hypothetical protein